MNSWEELKQECLQCHACSLAETRTNVVFGVGTPQAEVVIVGEAPGANEDKQGEPFVGRAGKLLDDMLAMIGLDRSRIYKAIRRRFFTDPLSFFAPRRAKSDNAAIAQ